MKQLIATHKKEIEMYTNLDVNAIANVTYLQEFDREVQYAYSIYKIRWDLAGWQKARCPLWGYPTENSYYRDASSSDAILSIRIPFLALHALDDPVWDTQLLYFIIANCTFRLR